MFFNSDAIDLFAKELYAPERADIFNLGCINKYAQDDMDNSRGRSAVRNHIHTPRTRETCRMTTAAVKTRRSESRRREFERARHDNRVFTRYVSDSNIGRIILVAVSNKRMGGRDFLAFTPDAEVDIL